MNLRELWCPTESNGGTPSRMQFDITSYSQDIVGNYSDVNWRIRLRTSGGSMSSFCAGGLWIDGTQVYFTSTTIGWNSWTDGYVLATGTKRIYHNSDGSKQFIVLMKQLFFLSYSTTRWGGDQYYSGDTSSTEVASAIVTANTIPRYPLLALGTVTRELNKLTVGVSNTRTGTITNWEVRKVSNSSLVTSGTSSTISFSLTGLSPNTNYNSVYKIRAYANGGWGDYLTLLVGSTNALPTFSVTNFDVGGKPKITLTNLNNISSYSVKVKDGSTTIKTVSGITTNNYEITLSSSELTTILNNHPNDIVIQLNYEVTVVSNSVSYGLNNPTGNMTIPDSLYKPTFNLSMIGYADQNSVSTNLTGSNQKIIKGISNVLFTLQPMTANGGATAVSYQVTSGTISNSGSHTGSPITVLLNAVNAGTASITAVDSRGKTTTVLLTYAQFVNYSPPSIESNNIRRSGGVTENLLFNIFGRFNNWSGLSTSNSIQSIQYRYKEKGTSTWSSYITLTGISYDDNEYSLLDVLSTGDLFDISTEYDIEVKVTDRLSYDTIETEVNSGQPLIWKDLANKLLGIGKKPDITLPAGSLDLGGALQVNDSAYVDGKLVLTENDIINNLTSTSAIDALSAGKGKELNDLITTLSIPKNAIMIRASATITVAIPTAWEAKRIPYNSLVYKKGNKFSFNPETGIVTYNGSPTTIKVSHHMKRSASTTAGALYPTSALSSAYQTSAVSDGVAEHIYIDGISNNRNIYGSVRCSGTGNAVISGTDMYSYLLIEEI